MAFLTKVTDINFTSLKEVQGVFLSSLPWEPKYASHKTYISPWHNVEFAKDHMKIITRPEQKTVGERKFDFTSTRLVTRKLIHTGRIELTAKLLNNPQTVAALWALSATRYKDGIETIKPEWDGFEVGLPTSPTGAKASLHTNLAYPNTRSSRRDINRTTYDGWAQKNIYWMEWGKYTLSSGVIVDGKNITFGTFFRGLNSQVPMYAIFGFVVPEWSEGITEAQSVELYNFKILI